MEEQQITLQIDHHFITVPAGIPYWKLHVR